MSWGRGFKYDKYLNKDDPIDNAILELIEEGKLTIGFVKINDDNKEDTEEYSRDILHHRGKNIS
jgi:hypothetical protein